jgi:hypothetical protein
MSTQPDEAPTEYPSAWRPRGAPVPDDELEPLAVETFLASLSATEFQALMARVRGLR